MSKKLCINNAEHREFMLNAIREANNNPNLEKLTVECTGTKNWGHGFQDPVFRIEVKTASDLQKGR